MEDTAFFASVVGHERCGVLQERSQPLSEVGLALGVILVRMPQQFGEIEKMRLLPDQGLPMSDGDSRPSGPTCLGQRAPA
ncbi:hypothetical protein AYX19_21080 (plasmid) [Paenarthrobacter ureafaciens]|nr:hypothetical protein AYX19_21080 [Paenarthrobacter ureafaciens]